MWAARYRLFEGGIGPCARARTSVETRTAGSTSRIFVSSTILVMANIAPGLMEWRSYRPHASRNAVSCAALGANRSSMTPVPQASWSCARRPGSSSPARHGAANESTRTMALARRGCVAANRVAMNSPAIAPTTAACWDPTVSRTARRSSIHSSSEGRAVIDTGSESPTPRLSNRMTRLNEANRSISRARGGRPRSLRHC
jgi:hypothetical protein